MLIRIRVTRCDTLLISHSPLSKSTFVTSPKITSLSIFTTGTYTLPSNQTSTRSPQPISTITSESSLCELKYFSIVSSHVSYRSKSLVPSPSKPSHSSSLNMRTLGRLVFPQTRHLGSDSTDDLSIGSCALHTEEVHSTPFEHCKVLAFPWISRSSSRGIPDLKNKPSTFDV